LFTCRLLSLYDMTRNNGGLFMADNQHSNHLLAALPKKEYARIAGSLEEYELEYSDYIYKEGARIAHVYFPLTGLISLLSSVGKHSLLEIGIVGNEGIAGLPLFLGAEHSTNRVIVQGPGTAVRLGAAAFNAECARGGRLPAVLRRFAHSFMSQISQSAICFRFHPVEQRLARWLLMTADRMNSNEIYLTQEFLSNMLGVRREAVNKAAVELQSRGLIQYSRGSITITSRRKLEKAVCKCYAIIRKEELAAGAAIDGKH
jgi:CRP-like cAMP-binding protein